MLRPREVVALRADLLLNEPPVSDDRQPNMLVRSRAPRNSEQARENKRIADADYRERTRERKRQYDRERYAARSQAT